MQSISFYQSKILNHSIFTQFFCFWKLTTCNTDEVKWFAVKVDFWWKLFLNFVSFCLPSVNAQTPDSSVAQLTSVPHFIIKTIHVKVSYDR